MTRTKKQLAILTLGALAVISGAANLSANKYLKTIEDISAAEEAYYAENGRYLQVIEGNRLPHYESGTVEGKLGKKLPDGVRVDVYQRPDGSWGYIVVFENEDARYSYGFGPEAAAHTFTTEKVKSATTT